MATQTKISKDKLIPKKEEKSGASMSFIFHLNSVLPKATYADKVIVNLYNRFNPNLQAVIPHSLGRIYHLECHSKEYEEFLHHTPLPGRSLSREVRNVLPSIHKSMKVSRSKFDIYQRFNQYNHHRVCTRSPGVVRVVSKNGRSSSLISQSHSAPRDFSPIKNASFHMNKRNHFLESKPKISVINKHDLLKEGIHHYNGESANGIMQGTGKAIYLNGDVYEGEWAENKKHGNGTYKCSKLKMIFKGEWVHGIRNGEGSVTFKNGDCIKGMWEDGKLRELRVEILYRSGQYYLGNLTNCVREGEGILEYGNGKFKGRWTDDKREGQGVIESSDYFFEGKFIKDTTQDTGVLLFRNAISVMTASKVEPLTDITLKDSLLGIDKFSQFSEIDLSSHDIVYVALKHDSVQSLLEIPRQVHIEEGSFRAGKLHGLGMALYGHFGSYIGNFIEGKRSGWGKMTYTDPEYICSWTQESEGEYTGQWVDDQRQGFGSMVWPNGMRYEGYFSRDKRDQVSGIMWLMTGEVYDGGWVDNMMHGRGSLTATNGNFFQGQFNKGRAEDKGLIEFSDGRKYEGNVSMFEPHGFGAMAFPSGDVYEGEFDRGNMHGKGNMKYRNGDSYQGNWDKGLRSGQGSMTYRNRAYRGQWKDNKKEGFGVLVDSSGKILYEGQWSNDRQSG